MVERVRCLSCGHHGDETICSACREVVVFSCDGCGEERCDQCGALCGDLPEIIDDDDAMDKEAGR